MLCAFNAAVVDRFCHKSPVGLNLGGEGIAQVIRVGNLFWPQAEVGFYLELGFAVAPLMPFLNFQHFLTRVEFDPRVPADFKGLYPR